MNATMKASETPRNGGGNKRRHSRSPENATGAQRNPQRVVLGAGRLTGRLRGSSRTDPHVVCVHNRTSAGPKKAGGPATATARVAREHVQRSEGSQMKTRAVWYQLYAKPKSQTCENAGVVAVTTGWGREVRLALPKGARLAGVGSKHVPEAG